ncbi:MAG: adenine nucleotide alpha hydrolase family protein [Anaerolineales bacterium]|nr:adenine nucleotide alpha hydrolase family protein [Anaerolineales bacterium]
MKCIKCGEKAVIHLRQHNTLALCKEDFLAWVPEQTQRFIEKYRMFGRDDRALVAVSGGKDSLSLWDILWRLGYSTTGLYIGLGIDGGIGYSDTSLKMCEKFAAERGLQLQVVDAPAEYGGTIPELSESTHRGRKKPCAVCGLVKRHIMNRAAREGGYDVLVTGHNLDDEASILMANTLNWISGYLLRQWPVLEAGPGGLVRKAKPLCRLYERDMAAYALLRGIEYVYEECPYSHGSKSLFYKEMLNRLEAERPGAKMSFYVAFLEAKEQGLFASSTDPALERLHNCPSCGQPTTAPGGCAFCRMLAKAV